MAFAESNSANTLSLNYRPGENKRLIASNKSALFSFGDFKIERNLYQDVMSSTTNSASFGGFSTLETLKAVNFDDSGLSISVNENELNLPPTDPESHVYFSSFYTEAATAINNIIENFPYAVLAWSEGAVNVFNYSEEINMISGVTYSTFSLHLSALTNQGNIIINSGNTLDKISLIYEYSNYDIQVSGETNTYSIKEYSFSGEQLTFTVFGSIFGDDISTSTEAIYIKPIKETFNNYYNSITSLEYQLLNTGELYIPDIEYASDRSYLETFYWPRTIDGFAPDSYGDDYETFKEELLAASEKIDEEKTNIFIKTIIPENYLEYDSDSMIYRTLVQSYAREFDRLKKFIDGIAYAHSINYNDEESVPGKFLIKLSNLLGWQLSDSFSELDLFEYLTTDLDEEDNSYSHFNLEIWKRIMVNIVWLYKKKGTRDALSFVFKLLGAPDCLVNFNEFVYDVERIVITPPIRAVASAQAFLLSTTNTLVNFTTPTFTPLDESQLNLVSPAIGTFPIQPSYFTPSVQPIVPGAFTINETMLSGIVSSDIIIPINIEIPEINSNKVDANGFVNYKNSTYIFQQGGAGRGDGQDYINQWRPEFNPTIRIDNVKVQTGNTDVRIGTKTIMNSKEVDLYFTPAKAIECDVFEFYQQTGSCWSWGSTGPSFSALTVPYEYLNFDCSVASPSNIEDMTLSQYIDYIFTNSIDPTTRKTNAQGHNTWHYPELKNIYLNYYFSVNPEGNHLTMGKLESFLTLLETHLGDYIQQLIPATTIFKGEGSITYKNPEFHRQKFVYKEGIDKGSTFQTHLQDDIDPSINPKHFSLNVSTGVEGTLNCIVVSTIIPSQHVVNNSVFNIEMIIGSSISARIAGWDVNSNVDGETADYLHNLIDLT